MEIKIPLHYILLPLLFLSSINGNAQHNGNVNHGLASSGAVALKSTNQTNLVTTTWSGGVWDNGAPDFTMNAVISSTFISGGVNLDANSLTINNNASVVISSGDTVSLTGSLIVEPGSLVVFNNNANLIQDGTTNTNSGAIIIKRNSSLLKRLDYTLWSSPVAGTQTLLAFSPETSNISPNNIRFYKYNTNTNLYDVTDPSTTTFANATGYLIRIPNNHPATTPTIWTGQFAGVPNNGDYTYTMADYGVGKRFNLVGNPYPSPLDATSFVTANSDNITGTLYFWRKTNNALNAAYCTWSTLGFVTNEDPQAVDPNGVIQIGQGFFVEATGNGTALNFDNTMRIFNHDNQFFRTAANNVEKNRIWLNVTNASGAFSQTLIGYVANATQGVDASVDGKAMNDGSVSLTSLIGSTPYAIQGRALPFAADDVVPLYFKATAAGDYTIALDHADGLFSGNQAIYLKDNTTGIIHDLHTGGYTFSSAAGNFDSRFQLLYQLPLAVAAPEFNANQVVLYTTSANELVVNSGAVKLAAVSVFDVQGRLLLEKKGINATQTIINTDSTNQLLLVQLTSEDGVKVTKKVIK
ncbi:T9SS type A sorting domain-containing protein [Flavobacterium silvisoli]|uniref:T9SS type A sorting domain-containing protein n=1 Tax=Flavobacterium silvisoli TaxID=2529433 RepID=A0A4Q9Z3N1_9FLAO|nr:T9SS sorting signal type C domain-containing protein [Flavobacterium silvisoli]TBX70758.1 T9SS type A sorting domain-containing protein [Flavobacterium silvisoli]